MFVRATKDLDPTLKMRRPPCPLCEWKMWLMQIEVGAEAGTEKHRYLCPRCEHEDVQEVRPDRPSTSAAA